MQELLKLAAGYRAMYKALPSFQPWGKLIDYPSKISPNFAYSSGYPGDFFS